MIDDNVTEITKEVIQTSPPNRPWVLSLIINVLLFAAVLYCISREKKAVDEKIEAERKYDLLVNSNISDTKINASAYTSALKECNDLWQKKYDDLMQKSDIKYNEVIEKRINELNAKSEKLLREAKKTNNQLSK